MDAAAQAVGEKETAAALDAAEQAKQEKAIMLNATEASGTQHGMSTRHPQGLMRPPPLPLALCASEWISFTVLIIIILALLCTYQARKIQELRNTSAATL